MEGLHVCCSSNFISKQTQFPLLQGLESQSQLPVEDSHVYGKWCVNFFNPANRGMQELLCHFTPVGWPNSNPCNCIPQLLPPLPFQLEWGALVPKPSAHCLPQQLGPIALCHETTIRPPYSSSSFCAQSQTGYSGESALMGVALTKGFLLVEMSLVTPSKHWEESQSLGNMRNSDVSEDKIWKEEFVVVVAVVFLILREMEKIWF